MPSRRSRYPHLAALCLALSVAQAPLAADPAQDEPLEQSIKVPPRSIKDITRMLSDYRQHDDLVARLTAIADAAPPADADRKTLFDFYWQRGLTAGQLGRVQQQIADLRSATDNGTTGTSEYARALRNLAGAELSGGNYQSALHYIRQAIPHIQSSGRGQLTGAYHQIVSIASQVGDFEMAQANLRELETTLNSLRNSKGWANSSHSWLANYARARGDFLRLSGKMSEAETAYREAARETDKVIAELPGNRAPAGDRPNVDAMAGQAEAIQRSIAQTLVAQGRLIDAEATARATLEKTLKRTGNASPDVARGLNLLAKILAEQGRYPESAKLAEASLEVTLRSGAAPDSLPVLTAHRATLAAQVALGNDSAALAIYDKIVALTANNPEQTKRLRGGDLDVVLALIRTGQAAKAEQMSTLMLDTAIKTQGESALRTAEVEAFHAMALADLKQYERAFKSFRKAIPILIERVRTESDAETASTRRQERLVIVIERYLGLLAEMQAQGQLRADFDAANEAFVMADFARGSSVQRALTRSAARATIRDPDLADLARKEQDAQRRASSLSDILSSLLAAPPEQQLPVIQGKIRAEITALQSERAQLKSTIAKRFPDYAQLVDPPPVSMSSARRLLQPGEVLVAWYFGRNGAYVWAISGNGQSRFAPVSCNRAQIAAEVARLRQALNPEVATIAQIPPFDVGLAHQLYRKLFAPVEDIAADARTLLVVPHAELGQLPLSLLVTAPAELPAKPGLTFANYREVPWLMRKAAVAQLPSITALASLRRLPPGDPGRQAFIGFGDPLFSEAQAKEAARPPATQVAMRGVPLKLRNVPHTESVDSAELSLLPRLPDTADEIRDIARTLGADPERDIFLRQAANEKSVMEADLSRRKVVMFATHGLVPGELDGLSQPALALSAPQVSGAGGDGLLTQEEILSLKLNADWVVLSACNTASGEGAGSEAVSGLGRAFFYAGARALLVSNWPVETEASRTLMTELFRRQAGNSAIGKAEALRQAMATMIDGPGKLDGKTGKPIFSYAHPLFWAPFVLVGD